MSLLQELHLPMFALLSQFFLVQSFFDGCAAAEESLTVVAKVAHERHCMRELTCARGAGWHHQRAMMRMRGRIYLTDINQALGKNNGVYDSELQHWLSVV